MNDNMVIYISVNFVALANHSLILLYILSFWDAYSYRVVSCLLTLGVFSILDCKMFLDFLQVMYGLVRQFEAYC